MTTVEQMSEVVPVRGACAALNVPPASYYRWKDPPSAERVDRRRPPLLLSIDEETAVLADLHSERFMDLAPAEVHATLLEEGTYHCSLLGIRLV